jgi:c-di-GMP-binding flagellar brake protein YcgR
VNFFDNQVERPAFKPTGSERRQFERRMYRADARLLMAGMPVIDIRTLDLSVGGMGVTSSCNPESGTVASVQFPLKFIGRKVVRIDAMVTVMHSIYSGDHAAFKLGLRFNGLSPNVAELIARFVLLGQ